MASIRLDAPASSRTTDSTGSDDTALKMVIATLDGKIRLRVPYSPHDIEHTNLAPRYGQVIRSKRTPLNVNTGPNLRVMSFDLLFGNEDNSSVATDMASLRTLATSSQPVIVTYSSMEAGQWRITTLSMRTTMNDPITNDPIRGEAQVEFTEASDPPNFGLKREQTFGTQEEKPPNHRVVDQDILYKLAYKYYGQGDPYWIAIAEANDLVDVHSVAPGTLLILP